MAEHKFYCITEVMQNNEVSSSKKEKETDLASKVEQMCKVPLVTSPKEEQNLLETTAKNCWMVVDMKSGSAAKRITEVAEVTQSMERSPNPWSVQSVNARVMLYLTQLIGSMVDVWSSSDDNLLKNIELFDKLSLRFSGRVLFIKDVVGSSEICCWSFYGHGKKVAEVCCTSIVYATDKKHTKVEFPEARIYEEALNILLYENRHGPDQEVMKATSPRGATAHHSDDEDEPGATARCRSTRQ